MKARRRYCGCITGFLGSEIVRVVFSDESGTGDEKREPIAVVAAVMFNIDSQWFPFMEDLAELPKREFKGHKLFANLRNGRKRKQADHILRAFLSAPARHKLPIFYAAIDRVGFSRGLAASKLPAFVPPKIRSRMPPGNIYMFPAFGICLEEVDSYVHVLLPNEQVLWITDDNERAESLIKAAHYFLEMKRRFPKDPEPLPPRFAHLDRRFPRERLPARPSHVIDAIYFGKSNESRALQLADICAHTIRLALQGDAAATPYFGLINHQIITTGLDRELRVRFEPKEDEGV